VPTQTLNYGTRTQFAGFSRLNSVANSQAFTVGAVDNSTTKAVNEKVELKVTLGSSGVSATGTVEVYALESEDNTTWSDGITGDVTGNQAANLKNAKLLAVLNANANSQVVNFQFDLVGQGGINPLVDVPKYWSLLVYNKSGAAFAASGNDAQYTPIKYDVA
jgi:hypothetical protein